MRNSTNAFIYLSFSSFSISFELDDVRLYCGLKMVLLIHNSTIKNLNTIKLGLLLKLSISHN